MSAKAVVNRRGKVAVRIWRHGRQLEQTVGPDTPQSWADARAAAERISLAHRVEDIGGGSPALSLPTVSEFSAVYLRDGLGRLARTTRSDRSSYLRDGGPLLSTLGPLRLDQVTAPVLARWWAEAVEAKGMSVGTGRHYLDVLADLLGYAADLGHPVGNAVGDYRAVLRRRLRTKAGRAAADHASRITPIESPAEITSLLQAARQEGLRWEIFVLLGLDAGLRQGEALGLRWGRVAFGSGEEDLSRHLFLDATSNRPRGLGDGDVPKSGRVRRVALSRRLRSGLLQWKLESGSPGPEALVLPGIRPSNFCRREWRRIWTRARIGQRAYKDLRDSYASHLLTAGVSLGYIAVQLGHANAQVTARHYARWLGNEYREPMVLEAGEVPADLLERLSDPGQPGRSLDKTRSSDG